jgi:hypothetical protein
MQKFLAFALIVSPQQHIIVIVYMKQKLLLGSIKRPLAGRQA